MSEAEFPAGVVVRPQEPLSRHLPLRTGGPCRAWLVVHQPDDLGGALAACKQRGWKWRVLGAGTRTVGRDGPCASAMVRLGTGFGRIDRRADGTWLVGAAVPAPALLSALGTVGVVPPSGLGAVAGSVGASVLLDDTVGWEQSVVRVELLRRGRRVWATLAEARGARRVVVLAVELAPDGRTVPVDVTVRPRSGRFSAGPREVRRSLRRVGLPSTRLRGIHIPEVAPEMLVNLGGGTARDLQLLHRSVLERVARLRGLTLESQMQWTGRAS